MAAKLLWAFITMHSLSRGKTQPATTRCPRNSKHYKRFLHIPLPEERLGVPEGQQRKESSSTDQDYSSDQEIRSTTLKTLFQSIFPCS